jgi:hypothetical protein
VTIHIDQPGLFLFAMLIGAGLGSLATFVALARAGSDAEPEEGGEA